jgi:hypothetical protein
VARQLGRGRHHGADYRTVLKIAVPPLILPYLVSGYAFAFVLSLNEYIVAYMTIGFTSETLQRAALRLHADHGLSVGVLRCGGGPGVRLDRQVWRYPQAARRDVVGRQLIASMR